MALRAHSNAHCGLGQVSWGKRCQQEIKNEGTKLPNRGLGQVSWGKWCRQEIKNEGTKLPSTMESTKRQKAKLDFSEVAIEVLVGLGWAAFDCGLRRAQRASTGDRLGQALALRARSNAHYGFWDRFQESKNEGTKLPSTMESTKRQKTKLDFSEGRHSIADCEGAQRASTGDGLGHALALHAHGNAHCGLGQVSWGKWCQQGMKNEGTNLPSSMESTKRQKTKLDFSEVAIDV
jgi:hypothetical protein